MSAPIASLLPDVAACRTLVDAYARRLDAACEAFYDTGKTEFPHLSRAEDEDIDQQCTALLVRLSAVIPDVEERWARITYRGDRYDNMVERLRDLWIRRRNLLRSMEVALRAQLELELAPHP